MVESEMGEVPKGWRVGKLSSIATYLNGLAMQNYVSESLEYIPVLKIRELSQGFFDESSDKAKIGIPKEYIIDDGDIIFSWSGTLKVEIWAGGKGGLNQHLFKVTSTISDKWFYYLWTLFHLKEFIRIAEGKATSLGHIKREHLDDAKVLIPNRYQLDVMDKVMNPIISSITRFKVENNSLIKLKNLLLVKMAKKEIIKN
jgi:type I restriction enzyme S subunit